MPDVGEGEGQSGIGKALHMHSITMMSIVLIH